MYCKTVTLRGKLWRSCATFKEYQDFGKHQIWPLFGIFFKNRLAMFDEIYSSILRVWYLTFFPVPPPLRCSRWCSTLSGDSRRSSPLRCWTEQRCGTWSNRRLNKLINLSFNFHKLIGLSFIFQKLINLSFIFHWY
jgi:hypothetical protein